MKCYRCNGSGVDDDRLICYRCGGSGEVEITNEDWFCSLSTEEKAEWLSNRDEFIYDCGQKGTTPKIMDKDEWEKWLKEVHK